MASSWNDQYAKCPYYVRDKPSRIVCQGVSDASKLAWQFDDKEDCRIQMAVFCRGKFQNCEVYRMLQKIYDEED